MNMHTRKMLLNVATGIAVAATAAAVFVPAAYAAPGTVTSNVNVRSGPGTNYGVVDTVRSGTPVDVQQCQGSWCFIAKPGPDGWISSTFIDSGRGGGGGGRGGNGAPGISIDLGGRNGPQINIGGGNDRGRPGRPPVVVEPDVAGEVCLYDRTRFRGESFCLAEGESSRNLGAFADRASSIDNPDGLEVEVCAERNFRDCRTYSTSASSLGEYDDYIVSVRVR